MTQSNQSRVFYRHLRTDYATASAGAGAYITDKTGKQYLDASGGAAVSCLGHGHPQLTPGQGIHVRLGQPRVLVDSA